MYKVRQLPTDDWQVYNSIHTNIKEIKIPICIFCVHEYDSAQVKQEAQEYADYLNNRDGIVMELLKRNVEG